MEKIKAGKLSPEAQWPIRHDLLELKEDILGRIPPVTEDDAIERIGSFLKGLFPVEEYIFPVEAYTGIQLEGLRVSRDFDVLGIAAEHSVSLKGRDVPKRVGLISLYRTIECNEYDKGSAFSFAVGLRRLEDDPKSGRVNTYWKYRSYPEKYRSYPENTELSTSEAHDVTYWAKYHVMIPNEGNPFLLINPIQSTRIMYELDKVERELTSRHRSLEESHAGSDAIHEIEYRLNLHRHEQFASIFKHSDRHLVLGLIALDAARSLGIRDIALPSEKLLTDDIRRLHGNLTDKIWREARFIGKYENMEEFLKQSPRVRVFELNP